MVNAPTSAGVNVVVVFAIVVGVVKVVVVARSHLSTAPVCPLSVKLAASVLPVHIVPLLLTLPPTLAGLTVIVA